jgi:hypothetical protein
MVAIYKSLEKGDEMKTLLQEKLKSLMENLQDVLSCHEWEINLHTEEDKCLQF